MHSHPSPSPCVTWLLLLVLVPGSGYSPTRTQPGNRCDRCHWMEETDSLLRFDTLIETELMPQILLLCTASRVRVENDPSQQGVVLAGDTL